MNFAKYVWQTIFITLNLKLYCAFFLFRSVRLILDISPVGRAVPQAQVKSTYLYKYMSAFDNFVLASEVRCRCEVDKIENCNNDNDNNDNDYNQ